MLPKPNKFPYKAVPKSLNQTINRKISYNSNPSMLSITPLIIFKPEVKQLSPLSYNSSPKGTKSPRKLNNEESSKDINSSENEPLSIKNIDNGELSSSKKKEKKSSFDFKMTDLQQTSMKIDEINNDITNKPQIKVTYSRRTSFSSKKGGKSPFSASPRYITNNEMINSLRRRRSLASNTQQSLGFRVNTQQIE